LIRQRLGTTHWCKILFDEDGDTKRRSIADETRGVRLDVELASRQLYELLYAIKVLVVKAVRPPAMSQEDWEELNRLCVYRDYLVTQRRPLSVGAPV
jgi:hypothetical protein